MPRAAVLAEGDVGLRVVLALVVVVFVAAAAEVIGGRRLGPVHDCQRVPVRDGRARRNAEEADGGEHLDDTNGGRASSSSDERELLELRPSSPTFLCLLRVVLLGDEKVERWCPCARGAYASGYGVRHTRVCARAKKH